MYPKTACLFILGSGRRDTDDTNETVVTVTPVASGAIASRRQGSVQCVPLHVEDWPAFPSLPCRKIISTVTAKNP